MSEHQSKFLRLAIAHQVLRFGQFTLKSGRVSPYFFNAGLFNSGDAMRAVGQCYADALAASGISYDMLFGPAYKGIPLATAVAIELAARGRDVPLAFNRKEAKQHGEGGVLIGAPLQGRVLLVDDVITAGTAIRESVDLVKANGADVAGVVIGLDRQECIAPGQKSASQAVSEELGVPVISVANLTDLLQFAKNNAECASALPELVAYRERYGV